ncbi:Oxidoreductase N-terminal [Penicillium capsulatum]|uniref:Oxidoreductase N-terminal n=1 Tax=Penicillium capsulatum TaxID=69766 RepID=A0A9W9HV74_9EURO|nr:Oxidoreductase N-terminal [Penicillium capsulatum]KAJ6105789.1 Oxidoreductase N-terminal [Penicillium capsulatum]
MQHLNNLDLANPVRVCTAGHERAMKEPLPADIPKQSTAPMTKPLRFLVIGAGSRGNAYARAVTKATPGVIHAVAEPHAFKRGEFGRNYIWGADGSPSEGQEFADWRDWVQWEVKRRQQGTEKESHSHLTTASNLETRLSTAPVGVDGVFICTLDETHVEIVQALAPLQLHILCEKPLALSLGDCLAVYRALQPPAGPEKKPSPPSTIFSIGHVLRYSPHNTLLRKLLLEDRVIGDIVSLEHCEPVGWWHFSHSYVRGNWRRTTAAGDGSLLTKSCHDIDFILWLLCSPPSLENARVAGHQPHFPRTISSVGSLTQFRRARKPVAAQDATNCLSCPIERECLYSAVRIYNDRHLARGQTSWPVNIVCPDIEDVHRASGPAAAEAHLLARLREDYDRDTNADSSIGARPWYGRCVYEADNTVCDDQVVTMAWDDEETAPHRLAKTALFHMIAPTEKQCERRGRIYGTVGEIEYDSRQISIYDFGSARTSVVDVPRPPPDQVESHGGGDYGLARQFVSAVDAVVNTGLDVETAQARFVGCTLEEAVRSHAVVFAAEEARREESVVRWKEWWPEKLRESMTAWS